MYEVGKEYSNDSDWKIKCLAVTPKGDCLGIHTKSPDWCLGKGIVREKSAIESWKEVKEPRKLPKRYIPIFENSKSRVYYGLFTDEKPEQKFHFNKIVDVIEIEWTEKV